MIFTKLCLLMLFTAGMEFDVRSIDGSVQSGRMGAIAAETVTLAVAEEKLVVPLQNVLQIVNRETRSNSQPESPLAVQLLDGSVIRGTKIATKGNDVYIASAGEIPETEEPQDARILKIASKQVHSVQFRSLSAKLQSDWNAILSNERSGDIVIIRKGEDALDYLEGIVESISVASVKFQFDGDSIDVPIAKLAGLAFYSAAVDLPAPSTVIKLTTGSILNASTVTMNDGMLATTTTGGAVLKFPVQELKMMDYGSGKIVYLGDIQPALTEVTPRFGSSMPALKRFLYAPRNNKGFDGKPLQLRWSESRDMKTYERGLALHSRTELLYRLNREYKTLKGVVGISPEVSTEAVLQLVIKADDEIIFDRMLDANTDPIELELNVEKRRQLKILVDYGDESDIADRLNLCDLRVIK